MLDHSRINQFQAARAMSGQD